MGLFSRSKKPSSPPRPSTSAEPTTTDYTQPEVFQSQYRPQPAYNGYQRPQAAHGRSQSFPPPQGAWGNIMTAPPPYQPYQQVFVSNYLLPAPPIPVQAQTTSGKKSNGKKSSSKLKSASTTNLNLNLNLPTMLQGDMPSFIPGAHYFNDGSQAWQQQFQGIQVFNNTQNGEGGSGGGAALYDLISSKFNAVLTGIDGEKFSGDERELFVYERPETPPSSFEPLDPYAGQSQGVVATRGFGKDKDKSNSKNKEKQPSRGGGDAGCPITNAFVGANYFAKVNLYANSRLPSDLPSVKLYIPTFPLLCIAAQYSSRVYDRPTSSEREAHVEGDWRLGTKAMVIKSVPMDSADLLVFAIRGSQTFLDWAVNLNSAPSSPTNFLDDPGNLCHAGFLSVARKMLKPVAARLRHLLQEDPRRSKCSLLITGHSAGGAVAALLYMHMLSSSPETESELNILTGCFRRIHCITFGAPPVSLLPLAKPPGHALRKSLFLGLVNEGDPVTRADKAYVRSLLDLYSSPAPSTPKPKSNGKPNVAGNVSASKSRLLLTHGKASASTSSLALQKYNKTNKPALPPRSEQAKPIWPVPPSTLSNAGRLILLRGVPRQNGNGRNGEVGLTMDDGVQARGITDELLRGVVFGDPVCHMMKLYARRVEVLATNAVIGR